MDPSRVPSPPSQPTERSWRKTFVHLLVWLEMVCGLSTIFSSIMLNPRIPVSLIGFHGAYIAIFSWLLYSTCRSTYLQREGPIHIYWIFLGSTIASFGVTAYTIATAPNSAEIALIALGLFLVGLILLPVVAGVLYCSLRGNFVMPMNYTKGKTVQQNQGVSLPQAGNTLRQVKRGSSQPRV